jgi:tetratricopeptide (TPR) repeat protein
MLRRALPVLALVCLAPAGADEAPLTETVFGADEHLVAASAALYAGDADTAIRESLAGLGQFLTPADRAAALANLCGAYVLAKAYDLAIARCSDALAIRERWNTYHNRALAYMHAGRYDEAARDIDSGLALRPESALLAQARAALRDLRQRGQKRTSGSG